MNKLVEVELVTLLGARYVFPDMPVDEVEFVLQHARRGEHCTSLTVHNTSGAVLVVPWRIVSKISYDGEARWTRQSSAA